MRYDVLELKDVIHRNNLFTNLIRNINKGT